VKVEAQIVNGPIVDRPTPAAALGAGAVLVFEGVVRPMEDGRLLLAMDYESYDPMSENTLRTLAQHVAEEYQLLQLSVLHSRGRVLVGERSLLIMTSTERRTPAIEALKVFIDRLKIDVPIWKNPVWR